MLPGTTFEMRVPFQVGEGWEPPRVNSCTVVPLPQAKTEDVWLNGFADVNPIAGKRLRRYPLLTVRAPSTARAR